jgi:hypothetical protein
MREEPKRRDNETNDHSTSASTTGSSAASRTTARRSHRRQAEARAHGIVRLAFEGQFTKFDICRPMPMGPGPASGKIARCPRLPTTGASDRRGAGADPTVDLAAIAANWRGCAMPAVPRQADRAAPRAQGRRLRHRRDDCAAAPRPEGCRQFFVAQSRRASRLRGVLPDPADLRAERPAARHRGRTSCEIGLTPVAHHLGQLNSLAGRAQRFNRRSTR